MLRKSEPRGKKGGKGKGGISSDKKKERDEDAERGSRTGKKKQRGGRGRGNCKKSMRDRLRPVNTEVGGACKQRIAWIEKISGQLGRGRQIKKVGEKTPSRNNKYYTNNSLPS